MVGDRLGEISGSMIVQRILPSGPGALRSESTHQGTGTLLGTGIRDIATYVSELRPDGTLYGEGNGVYTGDGGEMATWVGQGVGVFQDDGSLTFRGAIYLYSSSPGWQRLNSVAGVYEYQVAADGSYTGELWEWK